MQSCAAIVFKSDLKEFRIPTNGGVVSSSTAAAASPSPNVVNNLKKQPSHTGVISLAAPITHSNGLLATMRPPPPPPPPKPKDNKHAHAMMIQHVQHQSHQGGGPHEEPSSSIPDLGMFIFILAIFAKINLEFLICTCNVYICVCC